VYGFCQKKMHHMGRISSHKTARAKLKPGGDHPRLQLKVIPHRQTIRAASSSVRPRAVKPRWGSARDTFLHQNPPRCLDIQLTKSTFFCTSFNR
jgi:hypothetical protein